MKPKCAHCRKPVKQPPSAINRALRAGLTIYCDRVCAGLARRKHKTKAQKVAEKKVYDAAYRLRDPAALKERKATYFKATYDPAKAAIERKANMARHVEYCRLPEYREWKAKYDKKYLAKRRYGPFDECALLLREIEEEVTSRMSRYEIYMANGTINKTQRRKREYETSVGYRP